MAVHKNFRRFFFFFLGKKTKSRLCQMKWLCYPYYWTPSHPYVNMYSGNWKRYGPIYTKLKGEVQFD